MPSRGHHDGEGYVSRITTPPSEASRGPCRRRRRRRAVPRSHHTRTCRARLRSRREKSEDGDAGDRSAVRLNASLTVAAPRLQREPDRRQGSAGSSAPRAPESRRSRRAPQRSPRSVAEQPCRCCRARSHPATRAGRQGRAWRGPRGWLRCVSPRLPVDSQRGNLSRHRGQPPDPRGRREHGRRDEDCGEQQHGRDRADGGARAHRDARDRERDAAVEQEPVPVMRTCRDERAQPERGGELKTWSRRRRRRRPSRGWQRVQ